MRQRLRLITSGTSGISADTAVPKDDDLDGRPSILLTSGRRASAEARVPYLFLRHGTYYFKRKVPSDVRHGFPEFRSGQLFRSLGTGLLSQAKMLLAVEVTEFELRVAQIRREMAQQQVLTRAALARESYDCRAPRAAGASPAQAKLPSSGAVTFSYQQPWGGATAWPVFNLSSQPLVPQGAVAAPRSGTPTTAQRVSRRPASAVGPTDRVMAPSLGAAKPATPRRDPSPPATPASAVRVKRDSVAATTTMLHLYESWKLTQDRARSLATVHTSVMEFRTLHGPLPVAAITKSHARGYRDVLIERGLSKRTIENKLGHLSTLVRFGMRELIEDHTLNPFERIDIVGATGLYPAKERRAYTVAELNIIFGSRLYNADYRPGGQVTDAAYWLPCWRRPKIDQQSRVVPIES